VRGKRQKQTKLVCDILWQRSIKIMMTKPVVMLVLALAVIVAAALALMRVLGGITDAQVYDAGLKAGLLLLIMLVAALAVGGLSKPKNDK
jgi:hypothetical protein